MRNARKNLRTIWYALFNEKQMIYDDEGRPTFENTNGFDPPVEFQVNLSAGKSDSEEQPFGSNVQYDRIILTHDMDCPIDEHSLIWVKKIPEYKDGAVNPDSADYEVAAAPLDSQNVIRIPIRRRTN